MESYPCALPYTPKLPLSACCPNVPAVWYEIVCVSNVVCDDSLFLAFVATVNDVSVNVLEACMVSLVPLSYETDAESITTSSYLGTPLFTAVVPSLSNTLPLV